MTCVMEGVLANTTLDPDTGFERGRSQARYGYSPLRAAVPTPYSYPTSYVGPPAPSDRPKDNASETSASIPVKKAHSWDTSMPEEAWGAPDGVWNEDKDEFDFGLGGAEPALIWPSVSCASSVSSENLLDITDTLDTAETPDVADTKAWLSSLPEAVFYNAIIDAYRLRVEDEYVLSGRAEVGSVHAHDFPLPHFISFIELARRARILPDSWDPVKSVACQQVALDEDGNACILRAVDKDYLLWKYKDSSPIVLDVLRMLADKVYGRPLFSSGLRFFPGEGWWA